MGFRSLCLVRVSSLLARLVATGFCGSGYNKRGHDSVDHYLFD